MNLITFSTSLVWLLLGLNIAPPLELDQNPQIVEGIGAGQGISVIDQNVYAYGDTGPDGGVVVELKFDHDQRLLKPTGRVANLIDKNQPVATHPTGLTVRRDIGAFLGDTVRQRGKIFHINFDQMMNDGSLDGHVLNTTTDDVAVNGTRPCFVQVGDRWLIATSDYGDRNNAVRLYDPHQLKSAKFTSEPGVLVDQFPCGPFVQNLAFVESTQTLILIQNITAGLGWRLTYLDLSESIRQKKSVVIRQIDFDPRDELEGMDFVDADTALLLTSSRANNLRIAEAAATPNKN